jgi:hypothetical protein
MNLQVIPFGLTLTRVSPIARVEYSRSMADAHRRLGPTNRRGASEEDGI